MRIRNVLLPFVVLGEALLAGQSRRPQPSTAASYTASATAILVDVVVRDKAGHPVTDLSGSDFEIYEDGVRQKVGSFSVVQRSDGIGVAVRRRAPHTTVVDGSQDTDTSSGTATATDDQAPTTAILFDALTPEPLHLAQKAALQYVPMNAETKARFGVFSSEPGLKILQSFTDDVARVRRAVQGVTAAGDSRRELEVQRRDALTERLNQLDAYAAAPGASATFSPNNQANSTAAQVIIEQKIANTELRMLRDFDAFDRDHRGYGSSNALVAVVQSLSVVPGRKSIVYFSEGLPASPALEARLQSIISAANRGNVTIYAIDAEGLRLRSSLEETRKEIEAAGDERLRQVAVGYNVSDGPLTRVVERTEDLLKLDPQGGLQRLAEDTGGFLVRDTNDLTSAFRRIDEDTQFHYVLSYSPSNSEFDGKFRTIAVKVHRDGAQVFSRKGYLAIRSSSLPVATYEAPAIAALDRGGRPPNAFPISAVGLVFPNPLGRSLVPIVVHVRTKDLKLQVDSAKGTYFGQVVIVARLKDSEGNQVQILSQQYVLTGASKELDEAKQGEILFYRQPELSPGVYTLEAIAYDSVGEVGSARLSTITIPAADQHLTASSLVLVRRVESVPHQSRPENLPFYYGDFLLYPNTGEPLRRESDRELTFYFAYYPGGAGSAEATIEVLQSGRSLATLPIELSGGSGRVQHVGRLPVDQFPAGTYELRLHLHQGKVEEVRTAFFTIA